MRIACPACKTSHQVSVLQRTYRRLPCRKCGQDIPLPHPDVAPLQHPAAAPQHLHQPPHQPPHQLEELAGFDDDPGPSTPEPTTDPGGMFGTRVLMEAPSEQSTETYPVRSCEACAADYDARLDRCPLCGAGADAGSTCPHCGGSIHADAIKCKHCKKFLSSQAAPARGLAARFGWSLIAILALLLVALLVALLWRGVRSATLFHHPLGAPQEQA